MKTNIISAGDLKSHLAGPIVSGYTSNPEVTHMPEYVYPAFTPLALILERGFDRKRDCIDTAPAQQATRYASLGQAKVGMTGNGVHPEVAVPHGTRSRPSRGRI